MKTASRCSSSTCTATGTQQHTPTQEQLKKKVEELWKTHVKWPNRKNLEMVEKGAIYMPKTLCKRWFGDLLGRAQPAAQGERERTCGSHRARAHDPSNSVAPRGETRFAGRAPITARRVSASRGCTGATPSARPTRHARANHGPTRGAQFFGCAWCTRSVPWTSPPELGPFWSN